MSKGTEKVKGKSKSKGWAIEWRRQERSKVKNKDNGQGQL